MGAVICKWQTILMPVDLVAHTAEEDKITIKCKQWGCRGEGDTTCTRCLGLTRMVRRRSAVLHRDPTEATLMYHEYAKDKFRLFEFQESQSVKDTTYKFRMFPFLAPETCEKGDSILIPSAHFMNRTGDFKHKFRQMMEET